MKKKKNPHVGSDVLKDLQKKLKKPEFRKEYEAARLHLAVGQAARKIAEKKSLSVRLLAKKMQASPAQVERLFQDKNVTLDTLAKFAVATGKSVHIDFK